MKALQSKDDYLSGWGAFVFIPLSLLLVALLSCFIPTLTFWNPLLVQASQQCF